MEDRNERTVRLSEQLVQENVIALAYSENLLDELGGLSQSKRRFDVAIIDCTNVGYFFTANTFVEAAELAKTLLEVQGAMVFVKSDKAVAIIKESAVGLLTLHAFETLAQVYDYSPALARQIQQALGQKTEIADETSDISEQVLLSSVPVLTQFGIKLKAGMESNKRRNLVLCAIDNYTPLNSIMQKLANRISFDELLDELRSCEETGCIFPLFAKIPFLVHCFRNKIPFKLKDYLVESKMVTPDQIDTIIISMQSNQDRLSLGAHCVAKGHITARQLEVALQDQAFYGQGGAEDQKVKAFVEQDQDSKVHSLVGHLGNTDPAGLLQSLANNRESGVLSVEFKDLAFRAIFEAGKLVKAKLGKLKSNPAVTEFVSVWKEGVFVFLERQPPSDLADDSCTVTRPIDKLLMNSALDSDNIQTLFKKLPKGVDTQLEKVDDVRNLFGSGQLVDPQEKTPLTSDDVQMMIRLWREFDGLLSVGATIKKLGNVTTSQASLAITRLLHYGLLRVPAVDLEAPLSRFQTIVMNVANRIGVDRSNALLRLSLQATQGYSARARMFQIGSAGEVGVDLTLARTAGVSLSEAVKQLEDWQVGYIEYVSQEIDKNLLRDIVTSVYRESQGGGPGP
jgi:hypothetical protein